MKIRKLGRDEPSLSGDAAFGQYHPRMNPARHVRIEMNRDRDMPSSKKRDVCKINLLWFWKPF
jgi:hypothetical protein